jgi:PPM family protein phosphatase
VLTVRVGTATDTGRVRGSNEDRLFAGPTVFAVADGMGGRAAGEVASDMAVARLARLAERVDLSPADVRAGLAEANRDILASARQDPGREGMGTTVTGVGLISFAGTDHWVVFNVGDSRVYRFSGGKLTQVTVDHSEVENMLAAGLINAEQARAHPRRNVVTQVLGMSPEPEPDVWVFPATAGERFVICSDGLTLELSDDEIAAVLGEHVEAQPAADMLVRRAVLAGGRDNVTVVVIDHVAAGVGLDEIDADTVARPGDGTDA